MRDALRLLPVIVRNWLRTRAQLQLEILALRHQLTALQREGVGFEPTVRSRVQRFSRPQNTDKKTAIIWSATPLKTQISAALRLTSDQRIKRIKREHQRFVSAQKPAQRIPPRTQDNASYHAFVRGGK